MAKQTTFTPQEIAECALAALDNWIWEEEGDAAPEKQEALRHLADNPALICEDGIFALGRGMRDIWDFLSEYADSTAQNILAARR